MFNLTEKVANLQLSHNADALRQCVCDDGSTYEHLDLDWGNTRIIRKTSDGDGRSDLIVTTERQGVLITQHDQFYIGADGTQKSDYGERRRVDFVEHARLLALVAFGSPRLMPNGSSTLVRDDGKCFEILD
ncbi:hypothetical protein HGB25_03180 [Candidatus Saccharibacteria bacterium]|nr:hypothetical protein [Candidatus Saccharibacteria bacterium]